MCCDVIDKELVIVGRVSVVVVVFVVIFFVYDRDSIIFILVSNVWVGFGVVFGLLVLFSLFKWEMICCVVFGGMVVGVVIVLFWIYLFIEIVG